MNNKIWLEIPKKHTYTAAQDYLELLYSKAASRKMAEKLKREKVIIKKAKDILRASSLPLLPKDNIHVQEDIKKIERGEKLSPILLIRNEKTIIADGYHRICTIYYISEDLEIPCKITDLVR